MSAESVALIPQCVECGEVWLPTDGQRWKAYLTDSDPLELAFYCPMCAARGSVTTDRVQHGRQGVAATRAAEARLLSCRSPPAAQIK